MLCSSNENISKGSLLVTTPQAIINSFKISILLRFCARNLEDANTIFLKEREGLKELTIKQGKRSYQHIKYLTTKKQLKAAKELSYGAQAALRSLKNWVFL